MTVLLLFIRRNAVKLSRLLLPGIIFLQFSINVFAQVITRNDSFEGAPVHNYPPPEWNNCDDGVSTVDTQPFFGICSSVIAGTDGYSYISIVTREFNPRGTVETVWADLIMPLEQGHCYDIQLDVCISDKFYGTLDWQDYYFNNPARLEIYGFNGDCFTPGKKERLYASGIISKYNWQTYNIRLHPIDTTYSRIALRANFISYALFKNSALLVDNLHFVSKSSAAFIHENGILKLPETATGIQWYYNDAPVFGGDSITMPQMGSGIYKADYYDEAGCKITISEEYIVRMNEIKLYPNPTSGTLNFEFASDEKATYKMIFSDATGKIVKTLNIEVIKGFNRIQTDIKNLAPGPYYLKIMSNIGTTVFKVIVVPNK
jgi:hypothetical protein